jgi:hypothetical protein
LRGGKREGIGERQGGTPETRVGRDVNKDRTLARSDSVCCFNTSLVVVGEHDSTQHAVSTLVGMCNGSAARVAAKLGRAFRYAV